MSLAGDSPPASKRTKIPRKSKAVRCETVSREQKCPQTMKSPQRILCVFSRALRKYEGISAPPNRVCPCQSTLYSIENALGRRSSPLYSTRTSTSTVLPSRIALSLSKFSFQYNSFSLIFQRFLQKSAAGVPAALCIACSFVVFWVKADVYTVPEAAAAAASFSNHASSTSIGKPPLFDHTGSYCIRTSGFFVFTS